MTTITPAEDKDKLSKRAKKNVWLSRSLILPALIFGIVLTQIPFLVTIYFSLLRWNLLMPGQIGFAWFKNYEMVFTSGDLVPSILATVGITSAAVILSLIVGLIFALLLDRKFRGQALARTLVITPFLIMPAAASLIWKYSMFDTSIGVINWVVTSVGLQPITWSTDFPMATVIIVLT